MKLNSIVPVAALIASVSTALAAQAPRITAADIRPERELLITHPSVVDSDFAKYPGPWSFGFLVEKARWVRSFER